MNNLRHATNSELLCEAFLHAFTGQPLPNDEDLRKERSDEIPEAAKAIMRELGIDPDTWNTETIKGRNNLPPFFFPPSRRETKAALRRLLLATYLLPGMLKRLLKRSTRPPVATSRCLPVKNGGIAAHVEVQVVTNGGADFHDITARTGSSNFVVIWVNTFFMGEPQLRPRRSSSPNARHHAILVFPVAFYAADSVKHAVMVNLQCDIKRIKGGESYRI